MGPLVVLLLAALQPLSALSWDLAVSSEGRLDLLKDGRSVSTLSFEELYQARGLVYLPKRDVFLFSNSQPHVETSIYALKVNTTHINSSKIFPLVPAGGEVRRIQSIAYDPVDDVIYWTDSKARAIFKAALTPKLERQLKAHVLHNFTKEVPMFIAVDHCRRKLYWTNADLSRPTVETSLLDGSGRSIVSSDVTSPMGLAVDVRGRGWIYWLDDWDGIAFSVEAHRMDGSEKHTLHKGAHHVPFSLTLDQQALLWTDRAHEMVWRMNIGSENEEPFKYFGVDDKVPLSIVVKPLSTDFKAICSMDDPSEATSVVPSETSSSESSSLTAAQLCSSLYEKNVSSETEKCKCQNLTSGASQVDLCFNYCLIGSCVVTDGAPSCHCPPGRLGQRCEYDLCQGVCLNGGECHVNPLTKAAVCHCLAGFEGARCELRKDYCSSLCDAPTCPTCNCDSNNSLAACPPPQVAALSATFYDPVVATLACFCGALTLVAIFLSFKVYTLSRRPRLKRRVIVSRREVNVPSFDQPPGADGGQAPSSDTCEIMIENCCNMNICETPCFEPPNRLGRKMKKEDKKTLLANMEDSEVEEQEPSDS